MTTQTLPDRLIAAMAHYNCRVADVARISGVSQPTVHKIKHGQRTVNSGTLEKLEPVLSMTLPKTAFEKDKAKTA